MLGRCQDLSAQVPKQFSTLWPNSRKTGRFLAYCERPSQLSSRLPNNNTSNIDEGVIWGRVYGIRRRDTQRTCDI
jgi:hypothetical protein